jgi:hypothetical protein
MPSGFPDSPNILLISCWVYSGLANLKDFRHDIRWKSDEGFRNDRMPDDAHLNCCKLGERRRFDTQIVLC